MKKRMRVQMMGKRLTALALGIGMAFGLTACAQQSASKSDSSAATTATSAAQADSQKKLKIGFTANSLENETVRESLTKIQEKCDAEGWELTTIDYKQDLSTCIDTLENFITAGCDVILFQVPSAEGVEDVVKRAQEAGVIVGTYDSAVHVGDYYQTQSDEEIGRVIGEMAAAYVNEKLDGSATAVAVGLPSNPILLVREQSFIKAFEANCNGKVATSLDCANYNGDFAAIADVIAQAYPEAKIVLSIADTINTSACEGFNALGYTNEKDGLALFGCDCVGETLNQWRSGGDIMIQGSVWTGLPDALYENFIRCTNTVLTGERSDPEIAQEITAVTPANFREVFGE